MSQITQLLEMPAFQAPAREKESLMLQGLNELTEHHYKYCQEYRKIIDGIWYEPPHRPAQALIDLPFLPVSLFKKLNLSSIDSDKSIMTLTSSGTTGQSPSKVQIDQETSRLQQVCLANSIKHVLGPKRLPMLVIDSSDVFKNPRLMSARGAGVLGMMRFGHDHAFVLDANEEPDLSAIEGFLEKHGDRPFFMFGFTFMVWLQLYQRIRNRGFDLSNGILVHSGGWKKLEDQKVDSDSFRTALTQSFGLQQIYNFYGMVEQLGSIFLEGEDGLLHPPNYSEVVIRNFRTMERCSLGEEGIVQVLSLIPGSYPGHSLLTEDIGVVESVSEVGRFRGSGLRVLGRISKAELRGCSDVIAAEKIV